MRLRIPCKFFLDIPIKLCSKLKHFKKCLPSFTIPTARHFWNRQNWHLLRRLLSTGQSLFPRHTYFAFFCTVRYKNNKEKENIKGIRSSLLDIKMRKLSLFLLSKIALFELDLNLLEISVFVSFFVSLNFFFISSIAVVLNIFIL